MRVLAIAPDHASALGNAGILLTEFKQSEQAIAMFQRLLAVQPGYDYAAGLLHYERMHVCDWQGIEPLGQAIVEGIRAGRRSCKSLAFMALSDDAADTSAPRASSPATTRRASRRRCGTGSATGTNASASRMSHRTSASIPWAT